MVLYCWPHGLVVHVQLLSRGNCQIFFVSICLRGLFILLFCRIHGIDVPMPFESSQDNLGPQKGGIV